MGVAAYNRGSALIRKQTDDEQRDPVFILIEDLNNAPKLDGAQRPFQSVQFTRGNGGWWIECPVTGFGFWYKTLRKAVRSWLVTITAYDAKTHTFTAEPAQCDARPIHTRIP